MITPGGCVRDESHRAEAHTLRIVDLATPPEGFLPQEPEGGEFYRALQRADIEGFRFGYLAVYRGNKQVTVAPYFLADLRLNTLLPRGWLKWCLSAIRFRLACIGNPTTDAGRIQGEVSADTLSLIDRALSKKSSLVAYKGFGPDLPLPGYIRAKGLPTSVLPLAPDYFKTMKSDRRNFLKRKLKKAAGLRFEESAGLPEHLVDSVYALYLNTCEKAEYKFEKLTRGYFDATRALSHYLLFFHEDKLIGFNQLIVKGHRVVNRYVGLDYAISNDHGLYFAMFIRSVEFAVREGYTEIELGATSYAFKRKLGGREEPTWNYYRHTMPLMFWLLRKLRPVLEPSESDLR